MNRFLDSIAKPKRPKPKPNIPIGNEGTSTAKPPAATTPPPATWSFGGTSEKPKQRPPVEVPETIAWGDMMISKSATPDIWEQYAERMRNGETSPRGGMVAPQTQRQPLKSAPEGTIREPLFGRNPDGSPKPRPAGMDDAEVLALAQAQERKYNPPQKTKKNNTPQGRPLTLEDERRLKEIESQVKLRGAGGSNLDRFKSAVGMIRNLENLPRHIDPATGLPFPKEGREPNRGLEITTLPRHIDPATGLPFPKEGRMPNRGLEITTPTGGMVFGSETPSNLNPNGLPVNPGYKAPPEYWANSGKGWTKEAFDAMNAVNKFRADLAQQEAMRKSGGVKVGVDEYGNPKYAMPAGARLAAYDRDGNPIYGVPASEVKKQSFTPPPPISSPVAKQKLDAQNGPPIPNSLKNVPAHLVDGKWKALNPKLDAAKIEKDRKLASEKNQIKNVNDTTFRSIDGRIVAMAGKPEDKKQGTQGWAGKWDGSPAMLGSQVTFPKITIPDDVKDRANAADPNYIKQSERRRLASTGMR